MAIRKWVNLPSVWIEEHGLKRFKWQNGASDNTAALMALVVIAHHADQQTGLTKITYDDLCAATCSVPDDHIDPRRTALFMARSILREVRDGGRIC